MCASHNYEPSGTHTPVRARQTPYDLRRGGGRRSASGSGSDLLREIFRRDRWVGHQLSSGPLRAAVQLAVTLEKAARAGDGVRKGRPYVAQRVRRRKEGVTSRDPAVRILAVSTPDLSRARSDTFAPAGHAVHRHQRRRTCGGGE